MRQPRHLLSALLLLALSTTVADAQRTRALRATDLGTTPSVGAQKIHPQMRQLLADRGPSKAWVFFRDKDRSGGHLRSALAAVEDSLSPRQLARRSARRTLEGLVDHHDLPVSERYVRAVQASGADVVVRTSWLNAVSVQASAGELEQIALLPFVDRIEPVRRGVLVDGLENETVSFTTRATPGAGFYGNSHDQLDQINLPRVHQRGYTGEGVVIGVLDTGFHLGHEAFNQPGHEVDVLAQYDFVDDDGNAGIEAGDFSSQHSHGTYILGVLAAYLPGSLVGGAYDASFVLAKTEDVSNEYQQEEDFYVAGLQFLEANGADLATSSLGYIDWYTQSDLDGLTATTTIAVNLATANGMHCLTAAGNSGHDGNPSTSHLIAPSDAFQVITCGAVDTNGNIAGFSSDGPSADGRVKPELLATGVSTWTVCSFTDVNCLTQVNGTSLSTPILAAAVGCLVQAHPDWAPGKMRTRLFASGDDFLANGTHDANFVRGYGIPDMERAGFRRPVHELARRTLSVVD